MLRETTRLYEARWLEIRDQKEQEWKLHDAQAKLRLQKLKKMENRIEALELRTATQGQGIRSEEL